MVEIEATYDDEYYENDCLEHHQVSRILSEAHKMFHHHHPDEGPYNALDVLGWVRTNLENFIDIFVEVEEDES
jgi:hypothetical protein|tara:strand:+ start:2724 stop:2942 length:219 start_codon:yes stop_codon:yes gene_type:complete